MSKLDEIRELLENTETIYRNSEKPFPDWFNDLKWAAAEVERLSKALPWISVKDRLPENPCPYFAVWFRMPRKKLGDWAEASHVNGKWFDYEGDELNNVTHWLPITPPSKEVGS